MPEKISMHRGTIIVADEVYNTQEGKWVIAGTYQNWIVKEPKLQLQKGLAVYVRVQCETSGQHQLVVKIEDRARSPTEKPLLQIAAVLMISDVDQPIELGFRTKELEIKRPRGRLSRGDLKQVKLQLNLEIDGILLASAPLTITFHHPSDTHVDLSRLARPQ